MTDDRARWRRGMQAPVRSIEIDRAGRMAIVWLAPGTCCDMSGCIRVVRRLCPRVEEILTFSGARLDTCYALVDGEWRARPARWPQEDGPRGSFGSLFVGRCSSGAADVALVRNAVWGSLKFECAGPGPVRVNVFNG